MAIKEGFFVGDCVEFMSNMDDGVVDLTVTSPPYDNLRDYEGYSFDFKNIARQLYRVTKPGGIVVWVVGDKINGGRTLTSFRQGIFFSRYRFSDARCHDLSEKEYTLYAKQRLHKLLRIYVCTIAR